MLLPRQMHPTKSYKMKTKALFLLLFLSLSGFAQQTVINDPNFEDALIQLGLDNVLDGQVATKNIEGVTDLDISRKNIISLVGLSDFSSLENLNCSYNSLKFIDLPSNHKLKTLNCSNNKIENFYDQNWDSKIESINISNNLITDINTEDYNSLKKIICFNNKITELDLAYNRKLEVLICNNNSLQSIDLRNNNNNIITSFNSENNPELTCIFVDNTSLDSKKWKKDETSHFIIDNETCESYTYTSIPDVNFENKLINIGLDNVQDGRVLISNISKIETLDISNSNISDLTGIEKFKSLKNLTLNNNNISSIDLKNLINLEYLNCNNNQLSSLDLTINKSLRTIKCRSNKLNSLQLPSTNTLNSVEANENTIASLDFSNTPMITSINVNTNKLVGLDVSMLNKLTNLVCWNNQLTSLTFGNNEELKSISLNNNKIQNLDLSQLPSLETLHAKENNLVALDISNCTLLKELYIENNSITELNTSNNSFLEKITCNNNKLTSLDFKNNLRIKDINCEYNSLTYIDLRINQNDVKFKSRNNPSLTCIYALNPTAAKLQWTLVDSNTHFVKDAEECSNPIAENTETESNDTQDTANLIDANSKITASIGNEDKDDYFKLNITENGFISIAPENIELLGWGYGFYSTTISDVTLWENYQPISKGIYYIHFTSQDGDTEKQYSFTVSFTPELRPIDLVDNNSFDKAQDIKLNEENIEMLGYYSNGEYDKDYYKFVAPENGRLELTDVYDEKVPYSVDVYNDAKTKIDFTLGELEKQVFPPSFYPKYVFPIHYAILEKGRTYYFVISSYLEYHFAGEYRFKAKFLEEPKADFDYVSSGNNFFFNNKVESIDQKTYVWHLKKPSEQYYNNHFSSKGNPEYTFTENGVYDIRLGVVTNGGQNEIEKQIIVGNNVEIYPKEIGYNGKATIKLYNILNDNTSKISFSYGTDTIKAKRISKIDDNIVETVFFLENEPLGKWKLNITDKNKVTTTYDNKLNVLDKQNSEPGALSLWPIQNYIYLPNRWQDFTIKYKNTGGQDLANQQIWITVSDPSKTVVELLDGKTFAYPSYVYENNLKEKFDSIPPYVDVDKFLGEDVPTRIYPLYIPLIKKGESGTLRFKLKSSATDRVIVNVWTYDQENDNNSSSKNNCFGKTQGTPCAQQLLEKIATDVGEAAMPGVACAVSVSGEIGNLAGSEDRSVGSMVYSWASIAVNCGSLAFGPASGLINSTWVIVSNIIDYSMIGSNCYDKKHHKSNKSLGVGSSDPNSIVGPIGGGGENNYIQSENMAFYKVNFENKSIATAPAQEIWIHDTLDIAKFDMSKFSFGNIIIGDSTITIPDGLRDFIKEIDLRPKQNIIGRIIGTANDQGIIEVYFRSLNPNTLEDNTDPKLGILPPNNTSPEGEGSISYFVGLINPVNGAIYENKATIIFDSNDAITTNTWKNTIDTGLPNSSITSDYFDTEKIEVTLSINGNDALSGINDYIVFASHNGGAYKAIGRTTTSSLVYKFPSNGEYKFFSIATDRAYNMEGYKTKSETSITVEQLSLPDYGFNKLFKVYPNPTNSIFKIESKYKIIDVSVYNASGMRVEYFEGNNYDSYNISHLKTGLYLISINTERGIANKKLLIK